MDNLAAGTTNLTGGDITGNVSNEGTLIFDGGNVGGDFANSGVATVTGSATIGGQLTGSGTISLDDGGSGGGSTADELIVQGGLNTSGMTFQLDLDLSAEESDQLDITGAISGTSTLAFDTVGTGGSGTDIDLLTYTVAPDLNDFTLIGLPEGGALIYVLDDDGGGNVSLVSNVNPGIGALASGITLTKSLIGSVINRPSSPFIAGGGSEEDPCSPGMWGRVIGGTADATGTVTAPFGGNDVEFEGEISADYYGLQLGGDFSCFQGFYNGWNLSFGGLLGVNQGSTSQPVRSFNIVAGEPDYGPVVSRNETDFTQSYVGAYVGAARDRLFADLQYRIERTDFEVENVAVQAGAELGLDDSFTSDSRTLSGSIGYVFPIDEERGINFIPSGGFSYTQTDSSTVEFNDGVLVIEDSATEIGFIAGTISRTQVQPSGTSALNYFGTATYYWDFADEVISNFYEGSISADMDGPDRSEASNLNEYGEVSVGVNYTQLLEPGDFGAATQLNASFRVDARFSDTVESVGLTAQARIQF